MNKKLLGHLVFVCLLIGLGLRAAEYMAAPSLTFDESLAARKITASSLPTLIHLNNSAYQDMLAYPAGFLIAEKTAIRLLGVNEWSVRLFPFLCGVLALLLFAHLSREILPVPWNVPAVFLFAIAPQLVFASALLKPLSSDVFFCLGCFFILFEIEARGLTRRNAVPATAAGLAAVYFSLTAVFVLASGTAVLLSRYAARRQTADIKRLLFVGTLWLANILIYYFFSLRYFPSDPHLQSFWGSYFLPLAQGPARSLQWIIGIFHFFLRKFLFLPPVSAGLLALAGSAMLAIEKKTALAILLAPMALLLAFSGLKLYPFGDRTTILLVPVFTILIVEGIRIFSLRIGGRPGKIVTALFLILVLVKPLTLSVRQFLNPWGLEEIKPVLGYVRERIKPGDAVAVFRGAQPAYEFYAPSFGLPGAADVLQTNNLMDFYERLRRRNPGALPRRVWVVFTHVTRVERTGRPAVSERRYILGRLDKVGRRTEAWVLRVEPFSLPKEPEDNVSAAVYLYDFSRDGE